MLMFVSDGQLHFKKIVVSFSGNGCCSAFGEAIDGSERKLYGTGIQLT